MHLTLIVLARSSLFAPSQPVISCSNKAKLGYLNFFEIINEDIAL